MSLSTDPVIAIPSLSVYRGTKQTATESIVALVKLTYLIDYINIYRDYTLSQIA